MDTILYLIARTLIGILQALPINVVARFGRFVGGAVYLADARHRRVATRNMTMCLGDEKSPEEIKALVKENFRRIGENLASAVKTSGMKGDAMEKRLKIVNSEKLTARCNEHPPTSIIVAIGHFGNFEVFARANNAAVKHRMATTYRALRQPSINRLLLKLRNTTGTIYFERRSEGGALRTALRANDVILGLLSDQHSGDHGVRIPFFGHDCNTTKAPAVYALRFNLPLYASVCYRTSLAHWTLEVSEEIPTQDNSQPRTVEAIMLDVNRYFEKAVRKDPANWFWVHNRWKNSKLKSPSQKFQTDPVTREESDDTDRESTASAQDVNPGT
jgi:KDO2-lipid IV(A) lauroyltransferase